MIKVYCDGAYSSSRNQGGWAFVVLKDDVKIYSSFFPVKDTTNNRMEIQAAIEACKWAKENGYEVCSIPMMLEVRNAEQWDKESLQNYRDFLFYVAERTDNIIISEFCFRMYEC